MGATLTHASLVFRTSAFYLFISNCRQIFLSMKTAMEIEILYSKLFFLDALSNCAAFDFINLFLLIS